MGQIKLSIVSPVYKAEKIVEVLVKEIITNVSKITENFEVLLINDGSPDSSWNKIKQECNKDKRVKGIKLSRNFGQHYAITAGLEHAKGDWVIVMDCDLQDHPDEIINLYTKAQEGWDIVYAKRVNRKDNIFKRVQSKIFYSVYSYLSGLKTDYTVANFGIYKNTVINEYNKMKEYTREFNSMVSYLGFNTCAIDVKHSERYEGKSSYNLNKLLKLSTDIIISNSNKPLLITVKLGFSVSILSFILAFYNILAHYLGIVSVEGYTTTVFSIWFVGGLILFVLGIIGIYIGKIFDQVKQRQLFIVSEKINID